jgi:hypothetical protein
MSESTVKSWVYNRVTRYDGDMIMRFCWYFGISPDDLFVVPERPEENPKLLQEISAASAAA